MDKPAHGGRSGLCDECSARHQGICGALAPADLERLKRVARRQTVQAGDSVVEPAGRATTFSVILSGAVKLLKLLPDGRQQIVGLQYAPDFLGRPFLDQSDVVVEAATETSLCSFSRSAIERMIAETPGLEHRLYLQAQAELEEARELLLTLGRRTARERVATFLLFVARRAWRANGDADAPLDTLNLILTRAEIADFLGLTIETVSRQLNKLQAMNIIAIEHHRSIRVLDEARLHRASGEAGETAADAKRDHRSLDAASSTAGATG